MKGETKVKIYRQEWTDSFTRHLIIHDHGAVFLNTYDKEQEDFGGTALIWGLYVNECSRRNGIGWELLRNAEELARSLGHKSVVLRWESESSTRAVLNWYIRSGYGIVGHYRECQYTLEKPFFDNTGDDK